MSLTPAQQEWLQQLEQGQISATPQLLERIADLMLQTSGEEYARLAQQLDQVTALLLSDLSAQTQWAELTSWEAGECDDGELALLQENCDKPST